MNGHLIVTLLCTLALIACSESTPGSGAQDAGVVFLGPPTSPDAGNKQPPIMTGKCAENEREVIGANGPTCAAPCQNGVCPDGLECHTLTDAKGNPASFCIEPHPSLCQPCREDHECNPATSATQNRCVSLGAEGSFCGGLCGEGAASCPSGYTCTEINQPGAQPTQQCMPNTKQCQCSAFAITIGASTDCQVESPAGSCHGQRACVVGGLEMCDADWPKAETCNGKDDNCNGVIDEGVSSPCGGCEDSCVLDYVPGKGDVIKTHLDPEKRDTTQTEEVNENPFIWIANSGEHTVSRLNTKTGCEEARYYACSDPSRTAVALDGSGIVACRSDGRVYRIAVSEGYCKDTNGNGTIETSKDLNGDCKISPNEMVQDDECIIWKVQPGGNCARAAGVDAAAVETLVRTHAKR